jgi:hypothetical protein
MSIINVLKVFIGRRIARMIRVVRKRISDKQRNRHFSSVGEGNEALKRRNQRRGQISGCSIFAGIKNSKPFPSLSVFELRIVTNNAISSSVASFHSKTVTSPQRSYNMCIE